MSRRMSCALTVDAVRNRTKTVTRRHVDTWRDLKAGDRLTLVEKAQGLRKGERQVVLAEVEVVDVRVEPLADITTDDVAREGFPNRSRWWFISSWRLRHPAVTHQVRRIEWRYLP